MGQKKRTNQINDNVEGTLGADKREDAAGKPAANFTVGQETYDRVLRHVANGNYQKALDLLRAAGREPRLRNVIGVCLMRLGRIDEAVRIYRDLVLTAGCTWLRPDIPLVYKINYATSLALAGHPAGCLEILSDLKADEHPVVRDLRGAIKRWEKDLSFWQRLNWRFGRIEPKNSPVVMDTAPGEFEVALAFPESSPEVEPELE
jgi:tetratricopeptide (TPR) repeat protein